MVSRVWEREDVLARMPEEKHVGYGYCISHLKRSILPSWAWTRSGWVGKRLCFHARWIGCDVVGFVEG